MNLLSIASTWYRWWSRPQPPIRWRLAGLIVLGGLLLTPLVHQLPLLGYDWNRLFYRGVLDQYPPWMSPLFAPFRLFDWRLSLALANSLSLVCVAVTTACQARKVVWDGLLAALLALLTPSLYYMLWDGQIDGLILLGLPLLPWSIPLALLRPQMLGWVLLSRKRWTIGMIVWLALSYVVWGNWLEQTLARSAGSVQHSTAMGWATLGWPILLVGLAMLLGSKGDFWRLLAGAMLASPYVQPYHTVILLPALGRVSGWKRWVLWGWAWVVGLVPGFLGITRYLALGFPLAVWWFLRNADPDPRPSPAADHLAS